jgi:hypothetical protein
MKLNISIMVCTASLFVAFPVLGQGQGAGHGNASDHSGHDNDGNSAGHRRDAPHGFGDRNLILASPSARAAVATAATSVTAALSVGSLRTSSGAIIPASAQAHTYSVLIADPTLPASAAVISAALSTAGPAANAIVPSLMRSFSGLGSNPAQLPSTISEYNRFTKAASGEFIANPPPEFLALHTVLARLTAAATSAK